MNPVPSRLPAADTQGHHLCCNICSLCRAVQRACTHNLHRQDSRVSSLLLLEDMTMSCQSFATPDSGVTSSLLKFLHIENVKALDSHHTSSHHKCSSPCFILLQFPQSTILTLTLGLKLVMMMLWGFRSLWKYWYFWCRRQRACRCTKHTHEPACSPV